MKPGCIPRVVWCFGASGCPRWCCVPAKQVAQLSLHDTSEELAPEELTGGRQRLPSQSERLLACDQGLKNYRPPDKPTTKLEAKYYSDGSSNNVQGCDRNECNDCAISASKTKTYLSSLNRVELSWVELLVWT